MARRGFRGRCAPCGPPPGAERLRPRFQQLHLQPVLALPDGGPGGRPFLDPGAPVCGQAVFPALVQDRADTAGKAAHREGNGGDGQHEAAPLRAVPSALGPEVGAGEGAAPVGLDIAHPVGEVDLLAVQTQRALEGVPHAENAVGALHCAKEPEGPHDVGPQGGKGAVAQRAVEGKAVLLHVEVDTLAAKGGLPEPHLKPLWVGVELRGRELQPPGLAVGNDLERGGAAAAGVHVKGGDQSQSLPGLALMLQIPALKIRPGPLRAVKKFHMLHHPTSIVPGMWVFYNGATA